MKNNGVPQIVRGHEVWLEPSQQHFHRGEKVKVKVFWGDKMKPDGLGRKERWAAYVLDPGNKRVGLAINESSEDYYLLSFSTETEGFYTVAVENNAGIFTVLKNGEWKRGPKRDYEDVQTSTCIYQYAKVIATMGHPRGKYNQVIGHDLEIVPLNFGHAHVDNTVEVQVLYEGQPLAGVELKATYNSHDGKDYPISLITDGEGKTAITLSEKGNWMFIVKHTDETKKIEGEYDQKRLVATYVIVGVH